MSMDTCSICGEFTYSWRKHKCKPIYQFKHEDSGDEWNDIRAIDHEDAALEFAKKYNEDDYCLMNDETEVEIKGLDDDENEVVLKFCVGAELDIHYSVKEQS